MRKAGEKERKRRSARWQNAQREEKKAMARWRVPESATNSKEGRVNNALSARRKPPRLVWSDERERKRT
jgi:hypothetical protein